MLTGKQIEELNSKGFAMNFTCTSMHKSIIYDGFHKYSSIFINVQTKEITYFGVEEGRNELINQAKEVLEK